jgi:hypothetical protein
MGSSNLPGSVSTTFLNRLGSGAGPGSETILYADNKLITSTVIINAITLEGK